MCDGKILESDLWQSLEEANRILRLAYDKLCDMTTEEFSHGGDKEIRDMIAKWLRIGDE
jgi:hypothetical protein